MAFGITPKHTQDLDLENLTTETALVLIQEAAVQLKWKIEYISPTGLIARTKTSWKSWGGAGNDQNRKRKSQYTK